MARETETERKFREDIRGYVPGSGCHLKTDESYEPARHANVGLFGVMGSGKSALINSLFFAYKGTWEQIARESDVTQQGAETLFRNDYELTPKISLIDTQGKQDFREQHLHAIMGFIAGKETLDGKPIYLEDEWVERAITCPVFVLKHDTKIPPGFAEKFTSDLVKQLRECDGNPPILVITFADDLTTMEKEALITRYRGHGIPADSIFILENYTCEEGKHTRDVARHEKFLKIIWECLKRSDTNHKFRYNKRREGERIREEKERQKRRALEKVKRERELRRLDRERIVKERQIKEEERSRERNLPWCALL